MWPLMHYWGKWKDVNTGNMHLQFMLIAEVFYEVVKAYICPSIDWLINVKVTHTVEYYSGGEKEKEILWFTKIWSWRTLY